MLIDYAAATHPGMIRANNEDAYLLSALDGEEPILNSPCRILPQGEAGLLVAVADGMGGAAAGEVASREGLAALALVLFTRWAAPDLRPVQEADLPQALEDAVHAASEAVVRYSQDDHSARGMGSTLTAAVCLGGRAHLAQIGDSRAYLLRNGRLHQITEDQTLVNDLVNVGVVTREEARYHPHRNIITQALGSPQPLRVALSTFTIHRGDRLLLCSDGLHGEVADDLLLTLLQREPDPTRALETLVDAALTSGGRDNVTGILLAFDDPALPLPGTAAAPGEGPVPPASPASPAPRQGLWHWFRSLFGGGAS